MGPSGPEEALLNGEEVSRPYSGSWVSEVDRPQSEATPVTLAFSSRPLFEFAF